MTEKKNINEFDDASVISNKIKEICNSMTTVDYIQDDNIGSDFDDVESHIQDSSRYKIKSGFDTIDHMLGGGWDISTLNIIMAETSNGKCVDYNMLIKCKNKKTEEAASTACEETAEPEEKASEAGAECIEDEKKPDNIGGSEETPEKKTEEDK